MTAGARLDHVGIAVRDLDGAIARYRRLLGREPRLVRTVPERGVRLALFELGASALELMVPLDAESPVGRFLARRGAGLHHVAYAVSDLDRAIAELTAAGCEFVDAAPRVGAEGRRVIFIRPASLDGVLTELVEMEGA